MNHLPEPPSDFRRLCRDAQDLAQLRRLAGFRLGGLQLEQLERARNRVGGGPPGYKFRLGVICNATTDFLPAAIGATGLRYGLDIEVVLGNYGQVLQEALSPESRINQKQCDAVLLAVDHHGLGMDSGGLSSAGNMAEAGISLLSATRNALKQRHNTTIIFQSVAPPPRPLFGNMDGVLGGNVAAEVHAFNVKLRQLVRESAGDLIFDVEGLASNIGLQSWHSAAQWNVAKLQFSQEALPVYADHLVRLLAALRGKSRKCLVIDLDNTCWGGAVGDLGLEGIVIGQGSALGEAFLDVQRTALALRERGIILAVCSKNHHENAIQPFREHPDMLLREEHISVFQANWIDKATNLEEIARLLNIGLDSLVLLDDNPAERIQVREALPMVAVPELPEDPSLYPEILLNAGYFETVTFTAEDSQRASQYRANALRSQLETSVRDPHAYLSALEMKISFAHFDKLNRARITQLINKTNQFNLTTRRYSEAEVEAMEADPSVWTAQVRLVDRFGDNGMISCVIVRMTNAQTWEIDTWLMSCRVLARRVEECTMMKLIEHARYNGVQTLIGRYIPTAKNDMVRSFYPKLGFALVQEHDGVTIWQLDLAEAKIDPPPMTIEDALSRK